jgi:two-component system NtrC family sensor kinase
MLLRGAMNKSDILQNTLIAIAACCLIGVLAFFYDKTQAVDLREQNEVLGLLNELKDIDSRWDFEAQRARVDLGKGGIVPFSRAEAGDKALRDITSVAERTTSPALHKGLTELRKAIELKANLFEKFKTENHQTKSALTTILSIANDMNSQASTPHPASASLAQTANELTEHATQYYLQGQDTEHLKLSIAAASLRPAPEERREEANKIESAVQNLFNHIPPEIDTYEQLEALTSGPRLLNMTLSFNNELDAIFQEKERYRIYLIYYSGALLVLLTYMGFKLKTSNQSLEHRVVKRTQELSAAMKHLKESEAQLIQSEKMSSLGQMVAGVAHEINTPLAYVKNSLGRVAEQLPSLRSTIDHSEQLLELLRAGNDAEGLSREFKQTSSQIAALKQQQVLEELETLIKDGLYGTGQVAEIVSNLKNFSRLDRSKVSKFNLNEGLDSTLLLAKHLLRSIEVVKHFGQIPEIVCSPSQLNQVFLNLVTNAAQALPDERGTITLNSRADGGGVTIEVMDNGKGITPEVLPKIFDPFFTTKEIGKGTGLGLSISYKIIQQHGGRISVESKVGLGTKFSVWLPLKPPDEAALEG